MTSKEDIEKLRKDIEMDMLDDSSLAIYDSIIVDLENFKDKSRIVPRELKRFKIELQPMRKKQNVHYSNHIIDYINFNIRCWHTWDRLPITITDNTTQKQIILTKDDYFHWREKMYEWLGIPKEVLGVL